MPTPQQNIMLPCDSGADVPISSNSNAHFQPKRNMVLLSTQ